MDAMDVDDTESIGESGDDMMDVDEPEDPETLHAAALASMEGGEFEEAADYYSQLLAIQSAEHGDMSYEVGDLLLEYGRALFKSGQAKNRIFRDRKMEIGLVKKITEMQNPNVQLDDEAFGVEEEEEDDLKLAWDIYETARLIFERGLTETDPVIVGHSQKHLSTLRVRLADLNAENDQFDAAITDYRESLVYADPTDYKFYVDVCLQCAICHLYCNRGEDAKAEYEAAATRLRTEDLSSDPDMLALLSDLENRCMEIQAQLDGDEQMSEEQRLFQEAMGQAFQMNVLQGTNLLGGGGEGGEGDDQMDVDGIDWGDDAPPPLEDVQQMGQRDEDGDVEMGD